MLFSFGILFFLLGIIGGYIGKIYEEVKKRPDYIIKQEIGFG
jgi:dolichol-phosphate mannosyltransferase